MNLKSERKVKAQKIRDFINQIKESGEIVTEFTDELFFATVDKITANIDKNLIFIFKDGVEIFLNVKEISQ